MYSRDTLVLPKHLLESGQPKAAIARELGISRRLVYHLIATGQVERDVASMEPRQRVQAPPKLESFKPLIRDRLCACPALSAVRLLAECRAAGYAGGYSQLTAFVRQVRPRLHHCHIVNIRGNSYRMRPHRDLALRRTDADLEPARRGSRRQER